MMRHVCQYFTLSLSIQLSAVCWLGTAAAAPATDASGATAEASAHFSRGVELYRDGNLDAALSEFMRANEIAPDYRLLYNMAQIQGERHDYVRAIGLLEQYLQQGGGRVTAARRAEVEQEGAKLRERVGTLWVTSTPENATLWINDERVATLPLRAPVLLNPGAAKIRVEAEGRRAFLQELNVAGGDRPRLTVALEAAAAGTAMAAVVEPRIDYTPVWITGMAAGACGIGALTFALVTSGAENRLQEQLDAFPGDGAQIDNSRSKVRTFAGLTDGFTVATLVAAGVGVYYLAFPVYESEPGEGPLEPGMRLGMSAGLGSVTLEGSF
ncbi:MAG: hypothetical protein RL685_1041 [Pseudomonadota bacterium]|jgi:hypothetical protein